MSNDTATLPSNIRQALNSTSSASIKYARLQGYLEGYLDQMSSSKDAMEELISKLLSEMGDILNPVAGISNNGEEN
ncbi:MAG: hypothetical protein QNJ31_02690 [Candidatus Caenarcaniphilales bacterium]|nr:hypothetical protein [Candidatus Caenarcaniphilales bacterium]